MKAVKIAHKIRALRTTTVAWYVNQSSTKKEYLALKLRSDVNFYINTLPLPFNSQLHRNTYRRLQLMLNRAGQLVTCGHHTPAQ